MYLSMQIISRILILGFWYIYKIRKKSKDPYDIHFHSIEGEFITINVNWTPHYNVAKI